MGCVSPSQTSFLSCERFSSQHWGCPWHPFLRRWIAESVLLGRRTAACSAKHLSMDHECLSVCCSWEEGCLKRVGRFTLRRDPLSGSMAVRGSAGSDGGSRVLWGMPWILWSIVVGQMDIHAHPV